MRAQKLGNWLNLMIPNIVVATIQNPSKVAYVYPTGKDFITFKSTYK